MTQGRCDARIGCLGCGRRGCVLFPGPFTAGPTPVPCRPLSRRRRRRRTTPPPPPPAPPPPYRDWLYG